MGCSIERGSGSSKGGAALDVPATYISWAFVLISVPNLLLIVGMIVLFVLALVAPFPGERDDPRARALPPSDSHHDRS